MGNRAGKKKIASNTVSKISISPDPLTQSTTPAFTNTDIKKGEKDGKTLKEQEVPKSRFAELKPIEYNKLPKKPVMHLEKDVKTKSEDTPCLEKEPVKNDLVEAKNIENISSDDEESNSSSLDEEDLDSWMKETSVTSTKKNLPSPPKSGDIRPPEQTVESESTISSNTSKKKINNSWNTPSYDLSSNTFEGKSHTASSERLLIDELDEHMMDEILAEENL